MSTDSDGVTCLGDTGSGGLLGADSIYLSVGAGTSEQFTGRSFFDDSRNFPSVPDTLSYGQMDVDQLVLLGNSASNNCEDNA